MQAAAQIDDDVPVIAGIVEQKLGPLYGIRLGLVLPQMETAFFLHRESAEL